MNAEEVITYAEETFGTPFVPLVLATDDGRILATHRVGIYPKKTNFVVVVAGPLPVGNYLRKLYDGVEPDAVLAGMQSLASRQKARIGDLLSVEASIVAALTDNHPELAQLEQLYSNGVSFREMAELTGKTMRSVQGMIDQMRGMGFDLPYRHAFSRRRT